MKKIFFFIVDVIFIIFTGIIWIIYYIFSNKHRKSYKFLVIICEIKSEWRGRYYIPSGTADSTTYDGCDYKNGKCKRCGKTYKDNSWKRKRGKQDVEKEIKEKITEI